MREHFAAHVESFDRQSLMRALTLCTVLALQAATGCVAPSAPRQSGGGVAWISPNAEQVIDYEGAFLIELRYASNRRLTVDSRSGLIRSERIPPASVGSMAHDRYASVVVSEMTREQHLRLSRWAKRFMDSSHPASYPSLAPAGMRGVTRSAISVNGATVAWDNTSDVPGLKAEVEHLIDLVDGRAALASGFGP